MSDASSRRLLEDTQVAVKRLEQQLRDWPTQSPERKDLKSAIRALETEVETLAQRIDAHREREVTLRDSASRTWWRSPLAPWALGVAFVLSWTLAFSLLNTIDWWFWSGRLGIALLVLPIAVNLGRFGAANFLHRRRQRRIRQR